MKILLVEDDELLGDGVVEGLRHFGHVVNWLMEARSVISSLQNEEYNLVVLDLGLPDMDGTDLLAKIRSTGLTIPTIILTARDQIEDKLSSFELGADDYLVKPFDIRELEARIRALVRRNKGDASEIIALGKVNLNCANRTIEYEAESKSLSRREFPIVELFFRSPDKIFSREKLESLSYGWGDEVESNAIEVHIHNIRKKLSPDAIKTIRGVGYMLISKALL